MDIEAYLDEFLNDVQIRVASEGGFTDNAFAEVAATRLAEANEVENFQPCHYRSMSGKMRIDGYAFDDADDSVRVFIVHRSSKPLETLTQTEARPILGRLVAFLDASLTGSYERTIDENHPVRDFSDAMVEKTSTDLAKIRAYLLTDSVLSSRVKDWPEGNVRGIPVEFHIWDIARFYRAYMSTTGLDEIVVEFSDGESNGLPCLDASTPGSPYRSFLCAVPASLLARIYDRYGSRLLEGNVRAFLSSKGKINQGIRKTLLERPEMFFAYNNGISGVASAVTIEQTAFGPRLTSATDLQIVNGGQTTASIANVDRFDKVARLSETFVPMKLSVVAGEESVKMISDISRFANSQNKVSDADFFSNHAFHQRMEQISRRLLAPAKGRLQFETHWYYERARGQYLNEFTKLTDAQRERFRLVNPKTQIITKTDLAKSELAWQQRPHLVSAGAQIFFQEFARRIDAAWSSDSDAFHEEYYRNVVSRILMLRAVEQIVTKQSWYVVGYRAIIVSYAVSKLSRDLEFVQGRSVDLPRLWRTQEPYPELSDQLLTICETVFDSMKSGSGAQQNLTQWAKRPSCWDHVKKLPFLLNSSFLETLVNASEMSAQARTAKAMQVLDSGIDSQAAVIALGSDYWGALMKWAEGGGSLAASDVAALRLAGGQTEGVPSEKQSKRLLILKKKFEDSGFTIVGSRAL